MKAFTIFAPCTKKIKEAGAEDRVICFGFRAISVFRIEDTEGADIPSGDPSLDEWIAHLPLRDVAESWDISVNTYNGEEGQAHGRFSRLGETAAIALGVQNVEVFLHELMHAADYNLGNAVEKGQHWRKETVAEFGAATEANLRGADLTEANLTDANLNGANLCGADLTEARITRADLIRANLTWANLSRADLDDVDLSWAYLNRANLTDANLNGADLGGADLSRANLTGADLRGAAQARRRQYLIGWANLTGANLTGANLTGANLNGANLRGADLTDTDLIETLLMSANLEDTSGYASKSNARQDGELTRVIPQSITCPVCIRKRTSNNFYKRAYLEPQAVKLVQKIQSRWKDGYGICRFCFDSIMNNLDDAEHDKERFISGEDRHANIDEKWLHKLFWDMLSKHVCMKDGCGTCGSHDSKKAIHDVLTERLGREPIQRDGYIRYSPLVDGEYLSDFLQGLVHVRPEKPASDDQMDQEDGLRFLIGIASSYLRNPIAHHVLARELKQSLRASWDQECRFFQGVFSSKEFDGVLSWDEEERSRISERALAELEGPLAGSWAGHLLVEMQAREKWWRELRPL